ncbi:glycoside hydrolase superfamily [Circinella umbellata]|nr:glycoside hydrolase superfamily [Circinella umbellata]
MRLSLTVLATLLISGLAQGMPVEKRAPGSLWGITYTAKGSDGSCHNAGQVAEAVKRFKANGIKNIRTYSQECDQLPNILKAIGDNGGDMKVLAGVWTSSGDEYYQQELNKLEKNLKGANKDFIAGIAIGNEAVQNGIYSADQAAGKIHDVRGRIGGGYKFGTVDTPPAFTPAMVDASDIVWVNIHPYFGGVTSDQAYGNLHDQLGDFRFNKAKGKRVVVGEVGWPTAGAPIGNAQPNVAGLATLVKSLKGSDLEYYYFESHDSKWKAGQNEIELNFGVVDQTGKSKIPDLYQ